MIFLIKYSHILSVSQLPLLQLRGIAHPIAERHPLEGVEPGSRGSNTIPRVIMRGVRGRQRLRLP
jgi:hypothetical protein